MYTNLLEYFKSKYVILMTHKNCRNYRISKSILYEIQLDC